jgi:hypothetical protein
MLGSPRDFMPDLEALGHNVAIHGGREPVASRVEVLRDGTIGREESLGVTQRLEPLHAPLPLAGGLMGVFGPIVQIAVLAVLYTGQDFPFRGTIAGQFVGDDHPGYVLAPLQQLAEESLRRLLVPAALDENVQHVTVLSHSTPEVIPCPIDGEKYFVQVPLVAMLMTPTPELISIRLPELPIASYVTITPRANSNSSTSR